MDKTTEIIAHMVGIFQTTLEEDRMRDAYDKFKAYQAVDPNNDPLEALGFTFSAKYSLDGFTPSLRYTDNSNSDSQTYFGNPNQFGGFGTNAQFSAGFSTQVSAPVFYLMQAGSARFTFELAPPSSIAVVTFQDAYLSDNDLLLLGGSNVAFTNPIEFDAQLNSYHAIAKAIASPVSAEIVLPGENAAVDAIELLDKMATTSIPTLVGVSATIYRGEDVSGSHTNGEIEDAPPMIDDYMPVFMSDDEPDTDADVVDDGAQDDGTPDLFVGLDPGYSGATRPDIEDGHAVVAGANVIVNEAAINSAWIDAPVMSVAGDLVSLNVISQVNVLVDHDYGTFGALNASTAINAATLAATATTPSREEGDAPEQAVNSGLPAYWAVTRIDGDLISLNQIGQYTFVTDNDRADVMFESTNTYIGLGDNTVANLTDLAEFGFGYDLIMIGGNMITVNWITQMNVVVDNDVVAVTGDAPADVSGSDNLLFNTAVIESVGVDTYVDMQTNFASAGDDLANGADTIDESVAHDSLFEGVDLLRVLYVDGDLTTVNWIEQTNVLGDSDQVHLAMENLIDSVDVSVTTGSNVAINAAAILEQGIDSTIAVAGDVYDDALLYQAELIDTDADPLGVDMPALANEAVVFLAEDMLSPDMGPQETAIIATAAESTASSDVMQTMLA